MTDVEDRKVKEPWTLVKYNDRLMSVTLRFLQNLASGNDNDRLEFSVSNES